MRGNHLLRHEANSWLKLGRQQSEKAEVIAFTKNMPYSGTNRFFTGTRVLSRIYIPYSLGRARPFSFFSFLMLLYSGICHWYVL
jgi:hypothetical protein